MAQGNKERSFYGKYFREGTVLHSLQSAPEEREWLMTPPKGDVKPAEVVLFLGCNVLKTTHLVRTVMDIFKLLNIEFVAVAGAAYCCGIQHHRRGDTKPAHSFASATARNFMKFSPERVVMWCPSCIYFYDEIMQMRGDFLFQHVAEFLVEKLDRLSFQPQPGVDVAVHYHTGSTQSDVEARSVFQILSALPGVNRMDLGVNDKLGRQCTPELLASLGDDGWQESVGKTLRDAVEARADILCTLYHGCQRGLCRYEMEYPLKVEHYLTLVGRGLGIEHEDRHKKYLLMGDVDAIWEETSACAAASGVNEEEARAIIKSNWVDVNLKSPARR